MLIRITFSSLRSHIASLIVIALLSPLSVPSSFPFVSYVPFNMPPKFLNFFVNHLFSNDFACSCTVAI